MPRSSGSSSGSRSSGSYGGSRSLGSYGGLGGSRSYGSYSSSKNNGTKASSNTKKTEIQPTQSTTPAPIPAQTPTIQVQQPSIGSAITQGLSSGFGWGMGTSLARSIFGGGSSQQHSQITNTTAPIPTTIPTQPQILNPSQETHTKCFAETEEFNKCVKEFGENNCFEKQQILKMCLERV